MRLGRGELARKVFLPKLQEVFLKKFEEYKTQHGLLDEKVPEHFSIYATPKDSSTDKRGRVIHSIGTGKENQLTVQELNLPDSVAQLNTGERKLVDQAIKNPKVSLDGLKNSLAKYDPQLLGSIQEDAFKENEVHDVQKQVAALEAELARYENDITREQESLEGIKTERQFYLDRAPLEEAWAKLMQTANELHVSSNTKSNLELLSNLQQELTEEGKPGLFDKEKKQRIARLKDQIKAQEEAISTLRPLREKIDEEAKLFEKKYPREGREGYLRSHALFPEKQVLQRYEDRIRSREEYLDEIRSEWQQTKNRLAQLRSQLDQGKE